MPPSKSKVAGRGRKGGGQLREGLSWPRDRYEGLLLLQSIKKFTKRFGWEIRGGIPKNPYSCRGDFLGRLKVSKGPNRRAREVL
jgi:hypothetical protein